MSNSLNDYGINVLTTLAAQNTNLPDTARLCKSSFGSDHGRCKNVHCGSCPFQVTGDGHTLGNIRKYLDDSEDAKAISAGAEGSTDDAVKAPSHYQLFDGTESIEVIARAMTTSEFRGFCFGNVLKYRLRAGKKSDLANMEQDLKKAAFYGELFEKHKGLCYEA